MGNIPPYLSGPKIKREPYVSIGHPNL